MTSSDFPAEADLVIVGGGLAGHCAALAAAEAGNSAILIEKMADHGGSSIMAGGSFAFSGTDRQHAKGIEDSDELFRQDLIAAAGPAVDHALIELYLREQAASYRWLQDAGVEFHAVSLSSGTSVPRTHPSSAPQMMAALHARLARHPGITYLNQTTAERLLTAPAGRHVQGVTAVRAGRRIALRARDGVVLASGGFSRSKPLIQRFAPELAGVPGWGGEGNTGDGLMMGWALGADMLDLGYVNGTFGMVVNHYPDMEVRPGDVSYLRMAFYRGAIIVNLDAERFIDESLSYKKLGAALLSQRGVVAFQLFDENIMATSARTPVINDFESARDAGIMKIADSIPALAHVAGLPPETLERTVQSYNDNIREGRPDPLGRKALSKTYGDLVPIDRPPFYLLPCSAGLTATYCGLRVDDTMRVLDVHGAPIEGLFAAGEVVGGFHGAGYVSGTALGKAVIFGLTAARSALAGHDARARQVS